MQGLCVGNPSKASLFISQAVVIRSNSKITPQLSAKVFVQQFQHGAESQKMFRCSVLAAL